MYTRPHGYIPESSNPAYLMSGCKVYAQRGSVLRQQMGMRRFYQHSDMVFHFSLSLFLSLQSLIFHTTSNLLFFSAFTFNLSPFDFPEPTTHILGNNNINFCEGISSCIVLRLCNSKCLNKCCKNQRYPLTYGLMVISSSSNEGLTVNLNDPTVSKCDPKLSPTLLSIQLA